MPYATYQDLAARFGERMIVGLTDRGETALGVADQAVVERALSDTDAVIDGYLAGRYQLPLSPVPQLIADLALSIAIWKLHVAAADQKIEADYKDAIRTLRDIAQGVVVLQVAGLTPATTGGNGVWITDRERPFTAENLKGFC